MNTDVKKYCDQLWLHEELSTSPLIASKCILFSCELITYLARCIIDEARVNIRPSRLIAILNWLIVSQNIGYSGIEGLPSDCNAHNGY